ncbi:MAG: hypothetical protein ACYDGR_12465 [Candidatus Dormibacteria bacterium]
MSGRVANLRRAAERPLRIARAVAVGAAVLVVAGGVAMVAIKVRQKQQQRTLKGRAKTAAGALRDAPAAAGKMAAQAKGKARSQLARDLAKQGDRARPLHERILESAARTAATAAVGMAVKGLSDAGRPEQAPALKR